MTTTKKARKPRKKPVRLQQTTDRDVDVGFKPLKPIHQQAQFFQSILATDRNNQMLNSLRAKNKRYKDDIETAIKQNAVLSKDVEMLKSVSLAPNKEQKAVSIAPQQQADDTAKFTSPAGPFPNRIRSFIRDSKQNITFLEEDIHNMSQANISDIDIALKTPFQPSAAKLAALNEPFSGRRAVFARRLAPTRAVVRQQQADSSDELTGRSQMISRDEILQQSASESVNLRDVNLSAYNKLMQGQGRNGDN